METLQKLLKSITDVGRIVRATRYSLAGLRVALQTEAAFRQEIVLFVVLAPLGAWLGRNGIERSLLVGSLMLVLMAELVNSAVEAAVDRAGTEPNELAKKAKDTASAAVFIALALVVLTWGLLLADRWQ